VVIEEVAVLVVLVRRHRRAVGAAVRRAVDDEVPGAVEEETGPAAVRRVHPGLLDAQPVHALGALGIVVVVRDVGPRQVVCGDLTDAAHVPRLLRERAHHEDQHPAPVVPLERGDNLPVEVFLLETNRIWRKTQVPGTCPSLDSVFSPKARTYQPLSS